MSLRQKDHTKSDTQDVEQIADEKIEEMFQNHTLLHRLTAMLRLIYGCTYIIISTY